MELKHVFERREWMEQKMAELGIRPQDLAQERNVPGVPGKDGKPWTVDELLSIYAGMKNDRSRRAILYGNFKGRLDPEADAAECVKNLRPEEMALADAVIEEYERHFARIDSALIAVYNKGMDHEENYTPMRRLEYTTAEGLMDFEMLSSALQLAPRDAEALRASVSVPPVSVAVFSTWPPEQGGA